MKIEVEFTGLESPADILKAAIDEFQRQITSPYVRVVYQDSIPIMHYRFKGGDLDYSCIYRLDTMLLPFYAEAERIFDRMAAVMTINVSFRETLVRYIAFTGMTNMLARLALLQSGIFAENFAEARVTSRGLFLQSIIHTYALPTNVSEGSRAASNQVKKWIDEIVKSGAKKKRDYLIAFMNAQPLLHIQGIGRPLGSTKPIEQKAELFRQELKEAIQSLVTIPGKAPKKTDVAKKLNIGGENPKTGNPPTYLHALRSKLKRLGIDYDSLLAELGLNK